MKRSIRTLTRHVTGYLILLPVVLSAIALQAIIVYPIFKNQTAVPRLIYRACGLVFGIRFAINPQSAPLSTDTPTMFVSNHLARFDFVGLHLFPNAAVMMSARILQMPVWGPIVRAFAASSGFIATEQTPEGKQRDHDRLGQAVDAGRNIVVFPEGIQTDGRRVLRYSQGSAEIFYNPDLLARFPALQSARLQPVVLRLKTIDGLDVLDQPEKWEHYTLTHQLTNVFAALAHLSTIGRTTVDVLLLPPLDPGQFASADALINAAHDMTRAIVAPNQTTALTRRQWRDRVRARDFSL